MHAHISGPFSQLPNLRQILEAYVQFQQANLAGFVTDEYRESAEIDALLQNLAERVGRLAQQGYRAPPTFLGVGGMKLFRDDVWGRLRFVFQADHRAYRKLDLYDFPQKELKLWAFNTVISPMLKIPWIRHQFMTRLKTGMIRPYQKILQAEQPSPKAKFPGRMQGDGR